MPRPRTDRATDRPDCRRCPWARADHDAAKTLRHRLGEHFGGHRAILQGHGGKRREARLVAQRVPHAIIDETAPGETFLGRKLVAKDVEPAADELVINAV